MEIFTRRRRRGRQVVDVPMLAGQTFLEVRFTPDLGHLALQPPVALRLTVEQLDGFGAPTFLWGETFTPHILEGFTAPGKPGVAPRTFSRFRLNEQLFRDDIIQREGYLTRREIPTDTATKYFQCAIAPTIRITVDTHTAGPNWVRQGDAEAIYSVDVVTEDRPAPPVLLGRRSASLLGTFAAAENTGGVAVTSGSRTSIAGSLICGFGGSWDSGGAHTNTITDSKSNTWTSRHDLGFGSSTQAAIEFSYNNAGTRGTTHTVTNTKSGPSNAVSVAAGEFDGIEAAPTIVSNTATGTSTTPTVAVTAGANSLFVGMGAYDSGGPSTIAVGSGWTIVIEADENNDAQDFNTEYKVASTGAQTATWTISNSGTWGAIIVAFTESAAASVRPPIRIVSDAAHRAASW